MKRIFDILLSLVGLLFLSLPIFFFALLIWLEDFKNPFYYASRVGKNYKKFHMVKLRSMIVDAEKNGVESTMSNDPRITKIGTLIRAYKIDEFTQLWNVLVGNMSLVGPRPNTERGVNLYTDSEKKLLEIKPGMTDFASIVFSDEGEILKDSKDPDFMYDSLIRPWKSKLGILYCEKSNVYLDFIIIFLTVLAIFSKKVSLKFLSEVLKNINAENDLIEISKRRKPLLPLE